MRTIRMRAVMMMNMIAKPFIFVIMQVSNKLRFQFLHCFVPYFPEKRPDVVQHKRIVVTVPAIRNGWRQWRDGSPRGD